MTMDFPAEVWALMSLVNRGPGLICLTRLLQFGFFTLLCWFSFKIKLNFIEHYQIFSVLDLLSILIGLSVGLILKCCVGKALWWRAESIFKLFCRVILLGSWQSTSKSKAMYCKTSQSGHILEAEDGWIELGARIAVSMYSRSSTLSKICNFIFFWYFRNKKLVSLFLFASFPSMFFKGVLFSFRLHYAKEKFRRVWAFFLEWL